MSPESGQGKASATTGPVSAHWSFSKLLPILAFALSLFSLYLSYSAQESVARVDTVKTEYSLFNDMSHVMTEHPMMTHLFAVTQREYDGQVRNIKSATSSLHGDERTKLLLQERAITHYIFTVYEENYLLWMQAEGDKHKQKLLANELEFFNAMFCSNPRLAWYWDSTEGDGLSASFGSDLSNYYDSNVTKACGPDKDALGPFAGGKL